MNLRFITGEGWRATRSSRCEVWRAQGGGPDSPQMEPSGALAQGCGALFDGGVGLNPHPLR